MASLNRVTLIGRLTRDPEAQDNQAGMSITRFSIAVDRQFKDKTTGEKKTDFFNCTAFRNPAEFVIQYCAKGNMVCVEGSIENDEYTDKDGNTKQSQKIMVRDVQNLTSRAEAEANGQATGGGGQQQQAQAAAPRAPRPAAPANRPAAPANRPAAPASRKPVPAAVATGDDDDSDPFEDE